MAVVAAVVAVVVALVVAAVVLVLWALVVLCLRWRLLCVAPTTCYLSLGSIWQQQQQH